MSKYSKLNIVYLLQKWMDSVPGQTFLNYAYSWGASVVILGTLFKLTHLPGANFMLFAGMGTEVFVFFLSAFDRPFDKTAIGKDIPVHPEIEEEIKREEEEGEEEDEVHNQQPATPVAQGAVVQGASTAQPAAAAPAQPVGQEGAPQYAPQPAPVYIPQPMPEPEWVEKQKQLSPELIDAQENYVDELKKLTEMLAKVSEQSVRLTRDSEEMENLNRTLTGICKVYEMQLKGASKQIGTIDQINDQSRKMAEQIEQLNKIYARMIEAMTVNMRAAAPGNAPTGE